MKCKKILSQKMLINELHVKRRILLFTPFVLLSTAALVTECMFTDISEPETLVALAIVFFGLFIPLGVLVGIRQIVLALKEYHKAIGGGIQIRIAPITDIGRSRTASNSSYDVYLDFQNDFRTFVSRRKEKSVKIGDKYYVVYFSDALQKRKKDHVISLIAAYDVREYSLSDELKQMLIPQI